ncbi:MAG TPA: SAP domain-containing protein [Desulfuromonadaceae bacterium]
MKVSDIRKLAARHGLETDKMKKTEIIRAIQAAEGNFACFDLGKAAECGQLHCLWRDDCR